MPSEKRTSRNFCAQELFIINTYKFTACKLEMPKN